MRKTAEVTRQQQMSTPQKKPAQTRNGQASDKGAESRNKDNSTQSAVSAGADAIPLPASSSSESAEENEGFQKALTRNQRRKLKRQAAQDKSAPTDQPEQAAQHGAKRPNSDAAGKPPSRPAPTPLVNQPQTPRNPSGSGGQTRLADNRGKGGWAKPTPNGTRDQEGNKWLLYVTTDGEELLVGGKKTWKEFRTAFGQLGEQALFAGKHHPVVQWGFANKTGMVFPSTATDQERFLNLLPQLTVDNVSFKATKASLIPKNKVILELRIPAFGAETQSDVWMRALPLANGQQLVGSQAWPTTVTLEDGGSRPVQGLTLVSYKEDKFARGCKRLMFWAEQHLAQHIKHVQQGWINTQFGLMEVFHRGQPLANTELEVHQEEVNVRDRSVDDDEEDDEEQEHMDLSGTPTAPEPAPAVPRADQPLTPQQQPPAADAGVVMAAGAPQQPS